jgi:hypothetical protein
LRANGELPRGIEAAFARAADHNVCATDVELDASERSP